MMRGLLRLWVLLLALLVALGTLFLAVPVGAVEPQARESDWSNVEGLPGGTLVVCEDIDGKRHKGRLVSVADDAISVAKGKTVEGITQLRVARVWLLGGRKVGTGAAIGVVAGGIAGALLGASIGTDEPGIFAGIFALIFGGAGGGVGAAIGANLRERTLIYRAPPAGAADSAASSPIRRGIHSVPAGCPGRLPAPFSDVCRVFSTEQAARDASRELARRTQASER